MEQIVEIMSQIQELAGIVIQAIQEATGGGEDGAAPAEGGPLQED